MNGPLDGVRVLDLSRILAGPTCTQLLGDLGAEVIKVERPGEGDDTRKWGPPFVRTRSGDDTDESAYYLAANRNKRSICVDFTKPAGAALVRRMARDADVLIENYKVGGLGRHDLGYVDLAPELPRLVYCSISGFGQTGPRREELGYDFLIQAMGGIMSLTGEPAGEPMKVGVGIADVMCGMYATVGILAALRHRDATGEGQHIDLSLLDAQIAWLINGATNYLTSKQLPKRWGNAHPNVVPYQVFPTSDAHVVIAVGNDEQFRRACAVLGVPALAQDPRFSTNAARIRHRDPLVALFTERTATETTEHWVRALGDANVPAGPVNTLDRVFSDPQVQHREMKITMAHPAGTDVELLGNPLKLSRTPVSYRRAPPTRGQHTHEVLHELGFGDDEIAEWRDASIIE